MSFFVTTTIFAFVTMYGGAYAYHPMADGKLPYVGAVACPRAIPLETMVTIKDIPFRCADRLARRYDDRFDIFSAGTKEQMLRFGKQRLPVTIFLKK